MPQRALHRLTTLLPRSAIGIPKKKWEMLSDVSEEIALRDVFDEVWNSHESC